MHEIVNYEIGTGRAFDEGGDDIQLEFCIVDATSNAEAGYVSINGELHCCRDFELFGNLLSFWVRPSPTLATLWGLVAIESPPVGTLTYQTVCDVFNRLAKLESEGRHDGKTFYIAETIWGLLTAMGVVIDLNGADELLNYFGVMLDGSFREMNAEELSVCLEGFATKLGGEV